MKTHGCRRPPPSPLLRSLPCRRRPPRRCHLPSTRFHSRSRIRLARPPSHPEPRPPNSAPRRHGTPRRPPPSSHPGTSQGPPQVRFRNALGEPPQHRPQTSREGRMPLHLTRCREISISLRHVIRCCRTRTSLLLRNQATACKTGCIGLGAIRYVVCPFFTLLWKIK